jgi:hypothetical protein
LICEKGEGYARNRNKCPAEFGGELRLGDRETRRYGIREGLPLFLGVQSKPPPGLLENHPEAIKWGNQAAAGKP